MILARVPNFAKRHRTHFLRPPSAPIAVPGGLPHSPRSHGRYRVLGIWRCFDQSTVGFPEVHDLPVNLAGSSASAPVVLRGCPYPKTEFTDAFLNGTTDHAGDRERQIVGQALGARAKVANLFFADVRRRFERAPLAAGGAPSRREAAGPRTDGAPTGQRTCPGQAQGARLAYSNGVRHDASPTPASKPRARETGMVSPD